jgi:hypothetical protein
MEDRAVKLHEHVLLSVRISLPFLSLLGDPDHSDVLPFQFFIT